MPVKPKEILHHLVHENSQAHTHTPEHIQDMHVAQLHLGGTVLQAPGMSRPGNRPLAVHRAVKNILVTFHLTEEKNRCVLLLHSENVLLRA